MGLATTFLNACHRGYALEVADDATKRYGFTADEWARMVDSAYAVLAGIARQERTITYAEFCERSDLKMGPHDYAMSTLLDDLAQRSIREKGVILSAVLVSSDRERQPGAGFFQYATRIGFLKKRATSDDKLIFWTEQVRAAYAGYAAT